MFDLLSLIGGQPPQFGQPPAQVGLPMQMQPFGVQPQAGAEHFMGFPGENIRQLPAQPVDSKFDNGFASFLESLIGSALSGAFPMTGMLNGMFGGAVPGNSAPGMQLGGPASIAGALLGQLFGNRRA